MPDSIAPPHTTPSLPAELNDRIIDFLHDDWRALVACVLTAGPVDCPSPLTLCAKYHLSRTIDLSISGSHAELLDFLNTFRSGSPLTTLIYSIHIRGPPVSDHEAPRATFPALIDLGYFPHLCALALSHLYVEAPARFVRFLCRLPALEELSCVGLAPRPPAPGAVRLAPDIGPNGDEVAAFCRRLKALRIVDVECLGPRRRWDALAPLIALLLFVENGRDGGISASLQEAVICVDTIACRYRWVAALGQSNARLHTEVTLYETIGLTDTSASGNVTWDMASEAFLESMPRLLSRRSLCLRYDPWHSPMSEISTSEAIDVFLGLLTKVLTEPKAWADVQKDASRRWPYSYTTLQSFELVLRVPSDALANGEAWAALFHSLDSGSCAGLTCVKITLEPLPTPAIEHRRSQSPALRELSLEVGEGEDAVEMYADILRGALGYERDEQYCTFEVVVRPSELARPPEAAK